MANKFQHQKDLSIIISDEVDYPSLWPLDLISAFKRTKDNFPEKGIHVVSAGKSEFVTYVQLFNMASSLATLLLARDFSSGQCCFILYSQSIDYFVAFWACIMIGVMPVSIMPPKKYNSEDSSYKKIISLVKECDVRKLIAPADVVRNLNLAFNNIGLEDLSAISFNVDSFDFTINKMISNHISTNEVVFVQLSSGSTGKAKMIPETHFSILQHIYISTLHNGYDAADVFTKLVANGACGADFNFSFAWFSFR